MGSSGTKQKTEKVDAILMCGDKGASHPVDHQSKAFLMINGEALFIHVLKALHQVEAVRRVFIVGDKKKLDASLAVMQENEEITMPVITLEQWGGLLSNLWNAFLSSIEGYTPGAEKEDHALFNKTILALPGDAPLITSEEITEFIEKADMDKYDYVAGVTSEETLRRFYPSRDKPGVEMAYFNVREGLFRMNNLHLAKLFKTEKLGVAQKAYEARYQKKIINMVWFAWDLVRTGAAWRILYVYFLLHLILRLRKRGFDNLSDKLRAYISICCVVDAMGETLGCSAGYVVTTSGGAALDVDNDEDFHAMTEMYDTWSKLLHDEEKL